jgi:hypothetical protein
VVLLDEPDSDHPQHQHQHQHGQNPVTTTDNMRLSALTITALAGSAVAFPTFGSLFKRQEQACMTEAEATEIVDIYRRLIAEYTPEIGEKYCSSDFVDRSDSINVFLGKELGEATFPTKEIFMEKVCDDVRALNRPNMTDIAVQQLNAPGFPLEVDGVDLIGCDAIALRWHATFGAANLPSRGISILGMTNREGWWQIKSMDVEFNNMIWLLNMGGSYTWEGKTVTGRPQ